MVEELLVRTLMTIDELRNLVGSNEGPEICVDSRLVRPGDIFVAVKGTVYDGHDFIGQALANGAKYVVSRKQFDAENGDVIVVDDSAEAAALLAQARRGNPASRLRNLAVTGTNGKTTVAFLVRSIIQRAGQKCGLIGTVMYDTCSGSNYEAPLTTPDCLDIAAKQEEMVRNGAKFMVIEASSHALSQNRLAQIDFKAAAFTNLAGDHLDYHKTTEDYLAAKTRLFSALAPDATAVLNKQASEAKVIAGKTDAKVLWYGIDEETDLTAHIESMDTSGTVFALEHSGQSSTVRTPLLGLYNVSNCLAAASLCLAVDIDLETIAAGLSALEAIPGRLEKVDAGDFSVIIDYAHTDDALKNVLATLKPLCKRNLRIVFGCGGDRDKTKRPRMARVAEQLADFIIVTSDNPRTEDPDDIISDVVAGFDSSESRTIIVEPDRKKAIELAIGAAETDDIVLIAGKGHEDYQIIGSQKFHFSDKEIAEECIERRNGGSGIGVN
ncbi:MAG: UDP-N-acetylmuramoyl-L-alanyl-D-glutamate--2,6-diaminopimelate ligase [Planctomycetes bacterium B3_Pla]|nr:MAG: UDP-N-acetylmuramoyl-L-alanyl-D-glutamate--2,6-diaminopimelate ligase [Planctomycetes bacterium B3_Pla]